MPLWTVSDKGEPIVIANAGDGDAAKAIAANLMQNAGSPVGGHRWLEVRASSPDEERRFTEAAAGWQGEVSLAAIIIEEEEASA